MLFEADADHLFAVDPNFTRKLVGRQVICHLAPSTKKPAAHKAPAGSDFKG
jgi:hypothetical protein